MNTATRPMHTLVTRKTFGTHFAFYPRYQTSIDYRLHQDATIEILTAEILPDGGHSPIAISSASYLQLATHYRAELIEHAAAEADPALNVHVRSAAETDAIAWIIRAEAANARPGERKFGLYQADHPDIDIDSLTVERAADLITFHHWLPNRLNELPREAAIFALDYLIDYGSPAVAIANIRQALGLHADLLAPLSDDEITTIKRSEHAEAVLDMAIDRLRQETDGPGIRRVLDLLQFIARTSPDNQEADHAHAK